MATVIYKHVVLLVGVVSYIRLQTARWSYFVVVENKPNSYKSKVGGYYSLRRVFLFFLRLHFGKCDGA